MWILSKPGPSDVYRCAARGVHSNSSWRAKHRFDSCCFSHAKEKLCISNAKWMHETLLQIHVEYKSVHIKSRWTAVKCLHTWCMLMLMLPRNATLWAAKFSARSGKTALPSTPALDQSIQLRHIRCKRFPPTS
ncbi:unnamed protein product [Arctogadus glacialis]